MWLIDTANILHHGDTSGPLPQLCHEKGMLYYGRLIIIFSLLSTFQHALCRYRLPNPHDQPLHLNFPRATILPDNASTWS